MLPPTRPKSSNSIHLERFTRNSYPGVLCALVILVLTGLPGSCFPRVKPIVGLDKVVHMLMYAGFAFACLWGYRKPFKETGKGYRRKAIWITMALGAVLGMLTEIMQETLIQGRTGSVYDWIADVIGCIFGVIIAYFLLRDRNNLKNEALHK